MREQVLVEELERDPYVPLRLHLSDGTAIEIPNPDMAVVERGSMYLFRLRRRGGRFADDIRLISLRHIDSVERLDTEQQQPAA